MVSAMNDPVLHGAPPAFQPLRPRPGKPVRLIPMISSLGITAWQRSWQSPGALITVDLFCGAGGLSLGFHQAGFTVAAGLDADPWAVETYAANFLAVTRCLRLEDVWSPTRLVEDLGLPRVDILVGGPPCQGFARVGRGKLRSLRGSSADRDPRNNLVFTFARFVRLLRPLAFVMENVPDLRWADDGRYLEELLERFGPEYEVDFHVLDAASAGVPQRRRRLFIVGNRVGLRFRWPDSGEAAPSVLDAIADLPAIPAGAETEILPYEGPWTPYQRAMREGMPPGHERVVADHVTRPHGSQDQYIFQLMQEGDRYIDVPQPLRRYRSDIFRDKYRKLIGSEPSWTITAHIAKDGYRYIHPTQPRTISVREAARLQSFPDRHRFAGSRSARYRQIGNAVPPLMARAVAMALRRAVGG